MRTLGVVGGLGPETGCQFVLDVNRLFKEKRPRQPHVLLDNLPITEAAEQQIINGNQSRQHLDQLEASVERLERGGTDLIVIACNTVHVFIEEVRQTANVPVLSIIEETAEKCKEEDLDTIGLLGTETTIESGLYQEKLQQDGIVVETPDSEGQSFVNNVILKILNDEIGDRDRKRMKEVVQRLKNKGAEGVVLGCTDLPILFQDLEIEFKIIDSMKTLEQSSVERILSGDA